MHRSVKDRLALGVLCAASWQAHAQHLNIHVYDLARDPSYTLEEVTQEAARVLATAGVDVVWQQPPAGSPEAHSTDQSANIAHGAGLNARGYLVARIVRASSPDFLPGALGYSLPDAQSGAQVTIFYDRVEAVGLANDIGIATLLGHAMAHEIGHVLLGTTEHSPVGIMKAHWAKADYLRAAMGFLEFTSSERAAIQERLSTRPR